MRPIQTGFFQSPLGVLRIFCDDTHIIRLTFDDDNGAELLNGLCRPSDRAPAAGDSEIVRRVQRELAEYFARQRRFFTVPVRLTGTPFQRRVLKTVGKVPYGQIASYADIARATGTSGFRAVGQAVGRNPVPIFIPCHRIIRSDGTLGGFSSGLDRKRFLLRLEGVSPPPQSAESPTGCRP